MTRNDTHINGLLAAAGVYGCVECGKCVAICPMSEMYPSFSFEMSPRGLIKKALLMEDISGDEAIWCCTQCNACTELCPEGVACGELIKGLRDTALARGLLENTKSCLCCGRDFVSVPVMEYIQLRLREEFADILHLCPSCRRHTYLMRNS